MCEEEREEERNFSEANEIFEISTHSSVVTDFFFPIAGNF